MTSPTIDNLQKLLGTPRDGALLRYSLGNEWLKSGYPAAAVAQLREAVSRDPGFSAAWKLLGRALADSGDEARALEAWRNGVAAAQAKGDRQAEREMTVFARRIERKLST